MKIKYLGHSAFCLSGNYSVCIDPFDKIGFDFETQTVDFCLCSHKHFDHNATHLVNSTLTVFGEYKKGLEKISLEIIKSYHDTEFGTKRGENSLYKFVIDDITFCHLGDFGEVVNTEIKNRIGKVDVLFLPVGGRYTIDEIGALKVIEYVKPKIAIPMHYKTAKSNIDIKPISEFLKINPYKVVNVPTEFELEKPMNEETLIYLPDSSNY